MQRSMLLAEDVPQNADLREDGEALVEPKVLPSFICHEVAAPRVCRFVRHDVDLRAVLCQQGRGYKGEAWVLHATIGEAGRQYQQVVDPPLVGPAQLLRGSHELLRVLKLPSAIVHHLLLTPNGRTRAHPPPLQSPTNNGHQVRGNGHLLLEAVPHPVLTAPRGGLPIGLRRGLGARDLDRGHQHVQLGGAAHRGRVGHLALACVLAREHGAGEDGLALREDVGETLACSLRWREPLQRQASALPVRPWRGCLKAHADNNHLGLRPGGQRGAERLSQGLVLGGVVAAPLRRRQGGPVHVQLFDLQVGGRVQHQLPSLALRRCRVAPAMEVHGAEQPLPYEVHGEVEVCMEDPHAAGSQRLREGRGVRRAQDL
mmetsp:Transcript_110301/g.343880  ORF Transcript_110301/g.343880 Transcript_110301/m.343880 type:complete len:372 (-) Transcript_110301:49-1164(-)